MSKTITKHNPYPLFEVIREKGHNVSDGWEGIHYRNLYATYLLGPILLQIHGSQMKFYRNFSRRLQRNLSSIRTGSTQTRINEFCRIKIPTNTVRTI
jgi:hypothetical protein